MKKKVLVIISIFICITCIVYVYIKNIEIKQNEIKKYNAKYEQYLEKEISGVEIGTIINKAVDSNEKNKVEKDEKGIYKSNGENSIKIEIKIKNEDDYKTYEMEAIYMLGTTRFIENFNTINFKGKVENYHELNGKIAKIVFEEI